MTIIIDGVDDLALELPVLVTLDDTGSVFALREATVLRGDLAFRVYQSCDGPMTLRIESLGHAPAPGLTGYAGMARGSCKIERSWLPIATATLPSYSRDKPPSTLRECLLDAVLMLPAGTLR